MEKYKKGIQNNKFTISAPACNEEFELLHASYSVSDIQDCLKCILKKHGEKTGNSSIIIFVNKIENRIAFRIKAGYYLELLMSEIMKLCGSTKSMTIKDKNGVNVPHLEITEVVLVHCNILNNDCQQDSRA